MSAGQFLAAMDSNGTLPLKIQCIKTIVDSGKENIEKVLIWLEKFDPSLAKTLYSYLNFTNKEYQLCDDLFDLRFLKDMGLVPTDAPILVNKIPCYLTSLIDNQQNNELQNFLDCLSRYNVKLAINSHKDLVAYITELINEKDYSIIDEGNQKFEYIKEWAENLNLPPGSLKMIIGACIAKKFQQNPFPDYFDFSIFFNPLPQEINFDHITQTDLEHLLPILPFFTDDTTRITSLGLNSNLITDIPFTIAQLTDLETLNISDSSITTISEYICQLYKLHHLILSPEEFGNNRFIKALDWCGMHISAGLLFLLAMVNVINPEIKELMDQDPNDPIKKLLLGNDPIALFHAIITYNFFIASLKNIFPRYTNSFILPSNVIDGTNNLQIRGNPIEFLLKKCKKKIHNVYLTLKNTIA